MSYYEWAKLYFFVFIVGFCVALISLLNPNTYTMKEQEDAKKIKRARWKVAYIFHGCLLSMFVCYVSFEIMIHFEFSYRLSVALSGAIAYFGADRVNNIIERLINKKLGLE